MSTNSVSAMVSLIASFLDRKLTTCTKVVRYLALIVIFQEEFLFVKSALRRELITIDSNVFETPTLMRLHEQKSCHLKF